MRFVALMLALTLAVPAHAQDAASGPRGPAVDPRVLALLGDLPEPGDIQDILLCAGTNEIVWTGMMRTDPYSRDASEAKRKAGWYSAVALRVFAVKSQAVIDAVADARAQTPRSQVFAVAKRCRAAPDNWRE